MKSGGLFAGYGGLDMAVAEVFGAEPAWFSEIEDAPSKILAHHWPDVPNYGDITQIDWDQVEPVDILSGGFPCQDVSLAGKRAGMTADTRSGLWTYFAAGIAALRPRYVVIENVRGLLSAEAHSDVEPCPWCLGDGPGEPPLRALGAVLGDLADLGYDAQWCGLRAADVGAPHGRFRIFVLAANANQTGRQQHGRSVAVRPELAAVECGGDTATNASSERHGNPWPAGIRGLPAATVGGVAPNTARDGRHEGWPEPAGEFGGSDAAERGDALADTHSAAVREQPVSEPRRSGSPIAGLTGADAAERGGSTTAWGQYGPAVQRWERTLGRVAPAPTEPNSKGSQRLNPAFVEWMMGLAAGHVTAVPGVNRNAQLKALGNGVVPQQAIAALRYMYAAERREVA